MSPRATIFKTGDTVPEVIEAFGDYDVMFRRVLEPAGVECEVVAAHEGAALPDPAGVEMAIITGSPGSVTAPEPWAEALAEWCRRAHAARRPVLGVCYGHQLLAYAHGGAVESSAAGMEIGSTDVELTGAGRDDPLLGALGDTQGILRFNQVHGDVVTRLPEGAVHLAKNPHTVNQAFRLGDRCWAVQFHPEFPRQIMGQYIDARADRVRALAAQAGLDPDAVIEAARRSVADTPAGPALLRRFVELARARA